MKLKLVTFLFESHNIHKYTGFRLCAKIVLQLRYSADKKCGAGVGLWRLNSFNLWIVEWDEDVHHQMSSWLYLIYSLNQSLTIHAGPGQFFHYNFFFLICSKSILFIPISSERLEWKASSIEIQQNDKINFYLVI